MGLVGKNESLEYPGFYHVPGFDNLVIDVHGHVIDVVRKLCPLPKEGGRGYITVASNDQHRLLALTFLPVPVIPVDELDVNHIDGVKTNNRLDNLEWATRSENCLHAYQTGLRTDNRPVLVKDTRDGSIVRYYSLQACARVFRLNGAHIHYYLREGNYGKIYQKHFVFIYEGTEWPDTEAIEETRGVQGSPRAVVAMRLEDGFQAIFESMQLVAEHLGCSLGMISLVMNTYPDRTYRGWELDWLDDLTKLDESAMIRRMRKVYKRAPRKPVPIKVTHLTSGEVMYWNSVEEFGDTLGVKKNTIQSGVLRKNGYWSDYLVEYLDKSFKDSPTDQ